MHRHLRSPFSLSLLTTRKNYQVGSALKFPARTSSVRISYGAISFSDPTAVHLRYKLRETDKDWHEVPGATPVSYRNLAPGSYPLSRSFQFDLGPAASHPSGIIVSFAEKSMPVVALCSPIHVI